jgi:hypothetical protein
MRQKSSIVGRISILAPIRSGIRTNSLEVSLKADAVIENALHFGEFRLVGVVRF